MADYGRPGMGMTDTSDSYDNRKRTQKRPTKEYVEALVTYCGGTLAKLSYSINSNSSSTPIPSEQGFWGRFRYQCGIDMRFIRGEYQEYVVGNDRSPNFPDGFDVLLAPTPADKLRQSIDQVFIGDPQFTVELPKGAYGDTKRKELEQLFTKACYGWHNTEERESDTSPLKDIKHNVIGLGLGVLSTTLNLTKFPEKPERRKGEKLKAWEDRKRQWDKERKGAGSSVFAVRSIHPLNVAYDRAHTPPEWFLIQEGIDPFVAADEYPYWAKSGEYLMPKSDQTLITMTRYWSKDWTGCWLDGDPALGPDDDADEDGIAPNPYGFIPCWPAAGGHGHQDIAARPEWELQGMIRGARPLFVREGIIDNLKDVHLRKAAFGPQHVIVGPDDERELTRMRGELLAGPSMVPHLPPGYNLTTVEPAELSQVVLNLEQKNDYQVERATTYDVTAGSGTPTEPAARTRVRLQQVDKSLADAALHIEQAKEADYTARFQMIKHVLQCPVGVNVPQKGLPAEYVEIHPDDIPDGLVVKVKLVGESEEEKARKQQMLDQRLNAPKPTIDMLTYLEQIGEPDPEGIVRGMYLDNLRIVTGELLMMIARGQGTMMVAQAAEAAGIQYTPVELATAAMQAQVGEAVAATGQPMGTNAAQGGGAQPQQGQVNQQGAALPGTPYEQAESGVSDNPQVSRPDSGEALVQRLRLSSRMNGA